MCGAFVLCVGFPYPVLVLEVAGVLLSLGTGCCGLGSAMRCVVWLANICVVAILAGGTLVVVRCVLGVCVYFCPGRVGGAGFVCSVGGVVGVLCILAYVYPDCLLGGHLLGRLLLGHF